MQNSVQSLALEYTYRQPIFQISLGRLTYNFFSLKMPSTARILELSNIISTATQQLHDSLNAQALPLPSFEEDMTLTLPSNLEVVRDTLLDATSELHDLLYGFQNLLSSYGSVCTFAVPQKSKFILSTLVPLVPVPFWLETTSYPKSRAQLTAHLFLAITA